MEKLYEVIIGAVKVTPVPATETTPESTTTEELDRVDLKNVTGKNVEEVVAKVKPLLTEGQFIASVTKLSNIHA